MQTIKVEQNLEKDIRFIKGIGEKRALSFNRLGVFTVYDLINYYPRDYKDFSTTTPIINTVIGETYCVKAVITEDCSVNYIRKSMVLYKLTACDHTAALKLTFFNNRYIQSLLKKGKSYYFYGKITGSGHYREMVSPDFESGDVLPSLRPIYRLTSNLSSRQIGSAVKSVLDEIEEQNDDPLPDFIREKYKLCHINYAISNIHFPEDIEALKTARRRLAFQELVTLSLGMAILKSHTSVTNAPIFKEIDYRDFLSKLSFEPTGAQLRAIKECSSDMISSDPKAALKSMNRLLEGDVGSGKTLVAAALCYFAFKNSYQSALMAPTEILATQHYNSLLSLLSDCSVNVALLTGATKPSEKRKIKEKLKSGEIDLIIGTHALLTQDVEFKNLSLVITDEQHRFGVTQRASLVTKGSDPHVLVMSATPIPRTLGLIIYGDLDISILDEMPKGRQKIETFCVTSSLHERIYRFLKKHIDNGNQAYIVCPLVEESTEEGSENLISATEYAQSLQDNQFKNYKIGLLHGKMKPSEKEQVMKDFIEKKYDILVSTTVIEVGVDVPNAVVMVIENSERFGLSQLHQLRGRVGRGKDKSYCILVSDSRNELTKKRLDILTKTNDGFKIAEQDLTLRGPGDFFGNRQHGLPELKIADLCDDMDILKETQEVAKEILANDPKLEKPNNKSLKELVSSMFEKDTIVFN